MERTGQELSGHFPGWRTKADASAATGQEKLEVLKTFSWKPGKDIGDCEAEEDRVILDDIHDFESDIEDFMSEDYSVPTDASSPENNIMSTYEAEDWDKELAESEYNNNPYDFDDLIFSGNFQECNPLELSSVQEEPLYDPSTHHVAPVIVRHPETTPVDGQFDDAVD